MKSIFIFFLCVCLPPSNPAVNEESSLYFEWTSPLSLQVRNRDGDEDRIELRTSPKIGDNSFPCSFVGYLEKDRDSSVGVVGCKESEMTMIVIVSGYSSGTMFTLINQNKKTVELLNTSLNNVQYEEEELGRSKRSAEDYNYDDDYVDYDADFDGRERIPPNVYYEFGLSYDHAFLTKMNGNKTMAEEYVSGVVTLAQTYLKRPTLGTNVHFKTTKKIKYLEGQDFKINPREPGVRLNLRDATKIKTSEALIIFTYTDNEESWRGVASRRQACSTTLGRALVKHREDVQKAALTMAHEMGHLFGNYHDGKEDIKNKKKPADEQTACKGQGIMTANSTNRPEEWSSCSRDRLSKWYTRQGYNCLKTAPPCNNTGWFSPCSCGEGSSTNLCNIQNEGYCEHSTSTCVGVACSNDSDSWTAPCLCGRSLCTEKHARCDSATGTCLAASLKKCSSTFGCSLEKNTLLTVLPQLKKEFNISFEFQAGEYMSGWQSVIHLTEGGNCCKGQRIPALWVKNTGQLHPCFAVDGNDNYCTTTEKTYSLKEWHHVEFSQSLKNGKYMYRVVIDGETVLGPVENKQPESFSNVKVYAADPWHNSLKGSIRNLRIITEGHGKTLVIHSVNAKVEEPLSDIL